MMNIQRREPEKINLIEELKKNRHWWDIIKHNETINKILKSEK